MAILIEGIEMPKDKAVAVVIHPDGIAYTSEMVAGVCTKYLVDCTAVPVPEPHGDLIDRKTLMEGEGRYFISLCKEGIDVEEILRAKAVIPASEEG